jgi:hypothetical protein
MPEVVVAGTPVELRLHPAASDKTVVLATPDANGAAGSAESRAHLALTWVDRQGAKIGAVILESWGWTRLLLQNPTSLGEYDLRLGFVDQNGRFLPARCGWLARSSKDCALAVVRVSAAVSSSLANFDGKILLLNAESDLIFPSPDAVSVLAPGMTVPLTLTWQGLEPVEENYTISVQLVGPDGSLYGQTDTWPVQGTLPTSMWSPGQRFSDPYQVELLPDAPPGRYRLGVVVYLLETQTRLPLLGVSSRPIGDIAWVGEFEVVQR